MRELSEYCRGMGLDGKASSALDVLRRTARDEHWILDASSNNGLKLREPMDLETYYPVQVCIEVVETGSGPELKVLAESEGTGPYYDSHLKLLVDGLMSRLSTPPRNDFPGEPPVNDTGAIASDLEVLGRLRQRGLLSELEFEAAKRRLLSGQDVGGPSPSCG